MSKNSSYSRSYFEQIYKKNNNASVCKSELGYLFEMGEEDITLEEYIISKNNNKKL